MQHAYMYNGAFERNYPSLRPGATTYQSRAGAATAIPDWPGEVNGLRVGYMERRGKKFYAVRVQFEGHDIVLARPVPLDRMRHLGNRRFAAEPTLVDDDCASAFLDDAIQHNPEQRAELALLINRINQVRRGDSSAFEEGQSRRNFNDSDPLDTLLNPSQGAQNLRRRSSTRGDSAVHRAGAT